MSCDVTSEGMKFTVSNEFGAYLAMTGLLNYKTVAEEVSSGNKENTFIGYMSPIEFDFLKAEIHIDSVD
jgi:hypothetical protein